MIRIVRTNSQNDNFKTLVRRLDAELAGRDGADHEFYSRYNGIVALNEVVLAYAGSSAVGCGAIKVFNPTAMEIKRMYVLPDYRGRGVASLVLAALEQWTVELGYGICVLETGLRQPEAIALYTKNGYNPIPNYGPYKGVGNSRCFEKAVAVSKQWADGD